VKIAGDGRLGVAAALAALCLAAGPGTAATTPRPAAPGEAARSRFLMGTRLAIEVEGGAPEKAFEDAFNEVSRLETILSNWRETSEISRLNREAARAPVRCSPDLFAAVRSALRWAEATGGAFDPTVEPLVVRLGLRGEGGRLPSFDDDRAAAEAAGSGLHDLQALAGNERRSAGPLPIGWRHVHLRRTSRSVSYDAPGVGLDFGGIGKGIALDAAARVLRRRGVRRALLDFGGQVLAIGRPADAPAWLIGIADPEDRDRAIGAVGIADLSLSTSGNSERSIETEGGRVGHLLDPVTQRPARFEGSVTVAAPDGTSADALSTALFVMGPERGAVWADQRAIAALYLWRDEARVLRRRATLSFEERFSLTTDEAGS